MKNFKLILILILIFGSSVAWDNSQKWSLEGNHMLGALFGLLCWGCIAYKLGVTIPSLIALVAFVFISCAFPIVGLIFFVSSLIFCIATHKSV